MCQNSTNDKEQLILLEGTSFFGKHSKFTTSEFLKINWPYNKSLLSTSPVLGVLPTTVSLHGHQCTQYSTPTAGTVLSLTTAALKLASWVLVPIHPRERKMT